MAKDNIIIVGGGISGLNMGIQLKRQLNFDNFEIYEKGDSLGGTWYFNSYPGAGCDVPSHFYSLSYAPNPDWSHLFSYSGEINDYLHQVANKYDMPRHFRFMVECLGARWNSTTNLWDVTFKRVESGEKFTKTCKVFISAVGVLSIPNEPLPGTETFKGHSFHSSRWDHSLSIKDKEVIVIGNGCSATQIIPEIAKEAKQVKQFVQGQQYFLERPQIKYSKLVKFLFRYIPFFQRLYRMLIWWSLDSGFKLFYLKSSAFRASQEKIARDYMKKKTPAKYFDMISPKFEMGSKRRIFDTDYLDTLHRPNVDLSIEKIKSVVPDGVELVSGKVVTGDVIVQCNGFKTQDFLVPMEIAGDNGQLLDDRWKEQGGARAYLGTTVSGFPNFFMLLSAHTLQGHSSVIYTIECACNYVVQLVRPILSGQVIRVTEEAEAKYNEWIQAELKKLVWSQGDSSTKGWYVNKTTNYNATIYPGYQWNYWYTTLYPKWKDYRLSLS